ncbi:Scr1 family TA system antitoxin-like transcriptional regulator [Amycolatopsis sp. lyj-23]|uniref:Scr1 family TA system antitoxin-like transcriptional regulator n=1 Tax=Amycolatopsis sp. lyj-23 TaxID=2789283 RepID=UPI00397E3679
MNPALIALRQALCENDAAQILCYGGENIPDLVKTSQYARLCCQYAPTRRGRLWMRLHPWRVTAISGRRAPRVKVILSEAALYRLAAFAPGSDIVTRQVRHLIHLTGLTHISLRIYGFEHLLPPPSGQMTVATTRNGRTQTFVGDILSPFGVRPLTGHQAGYVTAEINRITPACHDHDHSRTILAEVLAHRSNLCSAQHCRFCGGQNPDPRARTANTAGRRT